MLLKDLGKRLIPFGARQALRKIYWGVQTRLVRAYWTIRGRLVDEPRKRLSVRIQQVKTRLAVSALVKSGADIKLEIGSGPVKGRNGWITMDRSTYTDLYWDLGDPLPFPAQSVLMMYSSHVLEHFAYPDLMRLLKECLRVLKPGGIFSACVPDARLYIQGYVNPETFDRKLLSYTPAVVSDQGIDLLNYIAYMDGHHKYLFDRDNLVHVLSAAGFGNVRLRDIDLRLDLPERQQESLYAVCTKP